MIEGISILILFCLVLYLCRPQEVKKKVHEKTEMEKKIEMDRERDDNPWRYF